MHRPFQRLNQVLHLLIARSQTRVHGDWGDYEGLLVRLFLGVHQPMSQQSVHRPLEGVAGAPLLQLHKPGNVVVNGKCGSHIMMLA